MGNILFRRKRIIAEELEELQQLSNELDEQIQDSVERKYALKWIITLFLLVIMGSAIAAALITVQNPNQRLAYSAFSFISGIFLIYSVQAVISGIYGWSIRRKRRTRDEITRRKVAILEKVKETETFKVAQEILTKYEEVRPSTSQHQKPQLQNFFPTENLLGEIADSKSMKSLSGQEKQPSRVNEEHSVAGTPTAMLSRSRAAFPRPPRPFFKQRSLTEKLVDYILGDGINHRYALICAHCNEHNGMAREEDFDYISYRCWICGEFNQARKQRVRVTSPEIRPSNAEQVEESAPASNSIPAAPLQKITAKKGDGEMKIANDDISPALTN